MSRPRYGLGYSPCPNDTFMFHALVHGEVEECPGILDVVLDDIAGLNERAFSDAPLPFTKLSACAFGMLSGRFRALRSGAALGRGCGPLVVVRDEARFQVLDDLRGASVGIPGTMTTAWLLTRIFGPAELRPEVHRFDQIMPLVARGALDAGLVIHEGRFTYESLGLRAVADLGERWESDCDLPLPLGLIAARADVPHADGLAMQRGLAASVRRAWDAPERSAEYVRAHAQEMDPEVCRAHIDLYVNEFSVDVGDEGSRAVEALLARGRDVGALPAAAGPVWW